MSFYQLTNTQLCSRNTKTVPSLYTPDFFFCFFYRRHGMCICGNMPHPFWVLIFLLRFNLPMSGFSRLLIRPWGVDSNTKRPPTSRRASRLILATLFTHMHGHIQPLRCWGNSPRLEMRFGETVLISPPWASFTLWLLSAAPVNKTGRNKQEGEQKSHIFSTRERTERGAGGEGIHLWTFSISNLFVKLKLH